MDSGSKYINMKAVAYMMDTNVWKNFAGSAYGATATGGPTIEMYALSYNAKKSTNKLGTYETISSTNANAAGYKVKIGSGSWDVAASRVCDESNMWFDWHWANSNMSFWISSPSSDPTHSKVIVIYAGWPAHGEDPLLYISRDQVDSSNGFRPVISIPKTSIK